MRQYLRFLVPLAYLAGCSGDTATGPLDPPPPPPATTGQIIVSIAPEFLVLELSLGIQGVGSWQVRPNSELQVPNLVPGHYRISLSIRVLTYQDGPDCDVHDGGERMATVRAGETTLIEYRLQCSSVPDYPRPRRPS